MAVRPSTLGELEVTLLKMLINTRNMVTSRVMRPSRIRLVIFSIYTSGSTPSNPSSLVVILVFEPFFELQKKFFFLSVPAFTIFATLLRSKCIFFGYTGYKNLGLLQTSRCYSILRVEYKSLISHSSRASKGFFI